MPATTRSTRFVDITTRSGRIPANGAWPWKQPISTALVGEWPGDPFLPGRLPLPKSGYSGVAGMVGLQVGVRGDTLDTAMLACDSFGGGPSHTFLVIEVGAGGRSGSVRAQTHVELVADLQKPLFSVDARGTSDSGVFHIGRVCASTWRAPGVLRCCWGVRESGSAGRRPEPTAPLDHALLRRRHGPRSLWFVKLTSIWGLSVSGTKIRYCSSRWEPERLRAVVSMGEVSLSP
jgi:hypothetical protein